MCDYLGCDYLGCDYLEALQYVIYAQTWAWVFEEVIFLICSKQRRRVVLTWVTRQNCTSFESIWLRFEKYIKFQLFKILSSFLRNQTVLQNFQYKMASLFGLFEFLDSRRVAVWIRSFSKWKWPCEAGRCQQQEDSKVWLTKSNLKFLCWPRSLEKRSLWS